MAYKNKTKLINKKQSDFYSSSDRLKEAAMYLLFAVILYLFFKSVFIILLLPVCIFVYHRINKKQMIKKYKEKLNSQFKDFLISLTASLRAGYSVENSIREAKKEMEIMFGPESPVSKETTKMVNKISLGIPCEDVFEEFAQGCGIEDICTFASVFRIAKRTGGDMVEIIKKTTSDIASKIDTKNEISVLISSKKFEHNIMSIMPVAIILYVELTSKGLLDPLYGNLKGILIMSVCLALYGFAYYLGQKIMNIEV